MTDVEQQLKQGVEKQLARLEEELKDLEEMRSEIDAEEYDAMRRDAEEQKKEALATLNRLNTGHAILGQKTTVPTDAVGDARLFSKDEAAKLREKLSVLDRGYRAGTSQHHEYTANKVALLQQLELIGRLLPAEATFLANHASPVSRTKATGDSDQILQQAARRS